MSQSGDTDERRSSLMPRLQPRLLAFAAVSFVAFFGLGELGGWVLEAWQGNGWWSIDLHLVLDAGARWSAHLPLYSDPKFLYPPLAAVLAWPLRAINFDVVSVTYAVAKLVLAVACVLSLTRGWDRGGRALAIVGLVCSLPFVHDLFLGNANILLVAAMVPAAFGADRPRSGVALGLAAAVFAKPLLAPFFLWLLFWRRSVLAGAVAAGGIAAAVGVVVAGPGAYVDWLRALGGGTRFAAPFEGNHGVTALVPQLWLPIAIATAAALVWVLATRGRSVGLVWAAASGIVIAPYAGTYAALPVALAMPAFAASAPLTGLAIVAVSPIATTHPLPIWAAAIMVLSLRWVRERRDARATASDTAPAGVLGKPA